MSYQYSHDRTTAGDLRLSPEDYSIVQAGYKLLRDELEVWNKRAIEFGAKKPPYEREVTDLNHIIKWGEELGKSQPHVIFVNGISVGSIRYLKAALALTIYRREQEHTKKGKEGWPSAALKALNDSIEQIKSISADFNYEPSDVLWEIIPKDFPTAEGQASQSMEWDVFISHASEDKEDFARPLAQGLREQGLKVWFDEMTLTIGDSLRQSIDRGLAHSRFGVVVISPDFLKKKWPQKELDGLFAREIAEVKVILPVLHNITVDEVRKHSPLLADRLAAFSGTGLNQVIAELMEAIKRDSSFSISAQKEKSSDILLNPNPSSAKTVQAKLKKILLEPTQGPYIHDLISTEINQAKANIIAENLLNPNGPFTREEAIRRTSGIEKAVNNLLGLYATAGYWGKITPPIWKTGFINLLSLHRSSGGTVCWIALQHYAATLVLYAAGLGGIEGDNLKLFGQLASIEISLNSSVVSATGLSKGIAGIGLTNIATLHGDTMKLMYDRNPLDRIHFASAHIARVLREPLGEFLPTDELFFRAFDKLEYLLGLVFFDALQEKAYGTPLGNYIQRSRNRNFDVVQDADDAVKTLGTEWPPLKAGLLGNSLERYQTASLRMKEWLNKINY